VSSVPEGFDSYHAYLRALDGYEGQLSSYRFFPPQRELRAEYEGRFTPILRKLELRLYSHQANALRLIEGAHNVVVATPTASGKSLVYQVPALQAVQEGDTFLYLSPTKALTADQLLKMAQYRALLDSDALVASYDGDTPTDERARLREHAGGILTNPDMLHYGILPYADKWGHFLARLRYVIIDEMHVYRGVFGVHVANLLRRLLRVVRATGAHPTIVAASATIGNPAQHAQRLTGEQFEAVTEHGSAAPAREFLFWEPPLLQGSDGRRRSVNSEAAFLAANFVKDGVRSIFFCNSRKGAELLRRYTANQLPGDLVSRVQSYRGGYTALDRRLIEDAFRNGDTVVLAATSALELGVDVGDVDAVVLVGYPGSQMSLWQRAGRAGRGGNRALTILIPGNDPLDEYYLHHPDLVTEGAAEEATADPFNSELHPLHVDCAAAELPVDEAENFIAPWLQLESRPKLYRSSRGWIYAGRYPHRNLAIRGTGGRRIRLVDGNGDRLGETDLASALRDLHPGAVYLHMGENYLVASLDLENGRAVLLPHIEEFYTQARSQTDIDILRSDLQLGGVTLGVVQVRHEVTGYVKKRYVTEAILDERPLDLPEVSYPTQAIWFDTGSATRGMRGDVLAGAIHALEHTMIGLLPAFVLCERADIGGVSYPLYPASGTSRIFIYDGYPGGVGYSHAGAHVFADWLHATRDLLRDCPCRDGCPRCILSPKCGNGNQYLDKGAALQAAEALLETVSLPARV